MTNRYCRMPIALEGMAWETVHYILYCCFEVCCGRKWPKAWAKLFDAIMHPPAVGAYFSSLPSKLSDWDEVFDSVRTGRYVGPAFLSPTTELPLLWDSKPVSVVGSSWFSSKNGSERCEAVSCPCSAVTAPPSFILHFARLSADALYTAHGCNLRACIGYRQRPSSHLIFSLPSS